MSNITKINLNDSEYNIKDTEARNRVASIKELIEKLNNENIDLYSYGVEWDCTVSSPVITRIGNPLLHKSLPIQSAYRGCIANGNLVAYYLDPNDWAFKEDGATASVLDGTDGSVRVHTPKFYGKSGKNGNKRWVRTSTIKIDDTWMEIPEMLVDAYRCTVNNNRAVSVVNTTAAFRGGSNRSNYDLYLTTELDTKDPFRSDLGKPRTNLSRATMRTYAANADSELLCYEYYKWIFYWNYVIEYANFNSQTAYNANLTSDGYHQGGLGPGVSTMSSWSQYNDYNPITPCGYGNEIGNFTGIVNISIPAFKYNVNSSKFKDWTANSSACTASNGANDSKIVTAVKSTDAYSFYIDSKKAWGSITYNISGLTGGLKVIFKEKQTGTDYTNAVVLKEVTEDGEVTVNWGAYGANDNKYVGFAITQTGCNIKIYSTNVNTTEVTQKAQTLLMPRWRGFDNPFGDIWTNLDGIILHRTAANQPSNVYTTTNPDLFGDSVEAMNKMTIAGVETISEGWIKDFDLGETGNIIPSACGGSGSTYMCDYHWCNPTYVERRTLRVGAIAHSGGHCGLGAFFSYYGVSYAHAVVGYRTLSRI